MHYALMIYSRQVDAFLEDEIALLEHLSNSVALGISKFRSEMLHGCGTIRARKRTARTFPRHRPTGSGETDSELRFTYFSEALKEVFGIDSDKLLGLRREDLPAIAI